MGEQPQTRSADTADFIFTAGEMESDVLKVTAFRGTEGISELFHFRIELCSELQLPEFSELVGASAKLEIATDSGTRFVRGIISSFERTGQSRTRNYAAAELVPLHWLLTKRIFSRVFTESNCADMSVPGVIKKVFKDAGVPDDTFRFVLERTYSEPQFQREMIVQYRESEMDFISRLMEEEGIFYFYEHTEEGTKLVIADGNTAFDDTPNDDPDDAGIPFREPTGLVPEKEYIYDWRDRRSIQHGKVTLSDFNFKTPQTSPVATIVQDPFSSLEYRDYPGGFKDRTGGATRAEVRIKEHKADEVVVHADATVRALIPGFRFTLEDHPIQAFNREYVVTRIEHEATQPESAEEDSAGSEHGTQHKTKLRLISSDVVYRPPRHTSVPTVKGSQTAMVVGPDEEEIHCDEYGRVRVRFHWDLEGEKHEDCSFWIRVSNNWAGGTYGIMFLPRIGQEVIVDFLEGDPDQPIITGRVYNNDNMPPYKLPDEKTKSTIKTRTSKGGGGFNELRFEDKKGDEQIFMHGEKDLDIRIKNDERDFIGRDKHEIIERHQKKKIAGGEGRAVGGDQNTSIGGSRTVDIKSDSVMAVGGGYQMIAEGPMGLKASDFQIVAEGEGAVVGSTILIKADVITLKSGGNFITIDGGGVSIVGSTVKINSGGAAATTAGFPTLSTTAPGKPDEAATGDPGQDYVYQQKRQEVDPLDDALTHDEDESDEKHWIGVRLYDDNGTPLVGERYIVVLPDGETVARGRTNRDGEAEIRGIEAGSCEIKFPALDANTWEAGPPPGGIATDGQSDQSST